MSMPSLAPQDAGTVQVRVQVIDMEPFALNLVVPTYIPAKDLTQRVARDAGLGAFWEDGTRRQFWIRARGRLLGDEERLQDLGIIQGELLHLLPQPPPDSAVMERAPEYPENKGYAGAGWVNVAGSLTVLTAWTVGWGIALQADPGLWAALLPALGLSLLSTSFARHLWGGQGSAVRVPVTGLLVFVSLLMVACVPALLGGTDPVELAKLMGPALLVGMFGTMLAWLAWYGAVEPLAKRVVAEAQAQAHAQENVQTVPCGICGLPVTPDVKADCNFQCGRAFHSGCYKARQSVARDAGCAVCGYQP